LAIELENIHMQFYKDVIREDQTNNMSFIKLTWKISTYN